jgi:hypothetical protein
VRALRRMRALRRGAAAAQPPDARARRTRAPRRAVGLPVVWFLEACFEIANDSEAPESWLEWVGWRKLVFGAQQAARQQRRMRAGS